MRNKGSQCTPSPTIDYHRDNATQTINCFDVDTATSGLPQVTGVPQKTTSKGLEP